MESERQRIHAVKVKEMPTFHHADALRLLVCLIMAGTVEVERCRPVREGVSAKRKSLRSIVHACKQASSDEGSGSGQAQRQVHHRHVGQVYQGLLGSRRLLPALLLLRRNRRIPHRKVVLVTAIHSVWISGGVGCLCTFLRLLLLLLLAAICGLLSM